jgi:signal transduction histidine kinase
MFRVKARFSATWTRLTSHIRHRDRATAIAMPNDRAQKRSPLATIEQKRGFWPLVTVFAVLASAVAMLYLVGFATIFHQAACLLTAIISAAFCHTLKLFRKSQIRLIRSKTKVLRTEKQLERFSIKILRELRLPLKNIHTRADRIFQAASTDLSPASRAPSPSGFLPPKHPSCPKNADFNSPIYDAQSDLQTISSPSATATVPSTSEGSLLHNAPSGLKNADSTSESSAAITRDAESICQSASDLDRLPSGLLRIGKVRAAGFNPVWLDMNTLLVTTLTALKPQINQAGAKVQFKDLPSCVGDKTLVADVFSSIILNALENQNTSNSQTVPENSSIPRSQNGQINLNAHKNNRTPKNLNIHGNIHSSGDSSSPRNSAKTPLIRIWGQYSGSQIVYHIQDNGAGIAAEEFEKIFEMFYRINPKSTKDGLGLAIVKEIVARHNGRIWLKSTYAKGSTFSIALPAKSF